MSAPVCQCSSWRPVVSTMGKSESGGSSGGSTTAGTSRARPLAVGKPSAKTMSLPGRSGASHGYVTALSRSRRSQLMLASDGITLAISA